MTAESSLGSPGNLMLNLSKHDPQSPGAIR
jgi:hypothetical protein